jgi:hypothetical protein
MLYDSRFELMPRVTVGAPPKLCERPPEARRKAVRDALVCRWVLTEAGSLELCWTRLEA